MIITFGRSCEDLAPSLYGMARRCKGWSTFSETCGLEIGNSGKCPLLTVASSGDVVSNRLPDRHRLAEEAGQIGFAGGAGREFRDAVLRQGPLDQGGDVGCGVAHRRQAVGHFAVAA